MALDRLQPDPLGSAAGRPAAEAQPAQREEAARILEAAWAEDASWGTLIWLVMTTGMRRGEVCALRRSDLDLDASVLAIPRSISEIELAEKDQDPPAAPHRPR